MNTNYTQSSTAHRASSKNDVIKPVTAASTCGTKSTASTGSSDTPADDSSTAEHSAASSSVFMGLDENWLMEKDRTANKSKNLKQDAKFRFNVDEVGKLARLGRNATIKDKRPIPESITKENIYVQVSLDERARDKLARSLANLRSNLSLSNINANLSLPNIDLPNVDLPNIDLPNVDPKMALHKLSPKLVSSLSSIRANLPTDIDITGQAEMEERVRTAIEDDLRAVYSATAEESKLTLLVVIAVMADGSLLRSLSDADSMLGLAEIGLMWRLFDSDDLTVYDGGVVVENEEVHQNVFDFLFPDRDRYNLMENLVPRVANDIMCRIAESNDHFMVEI